MQQKIIFTMKLVLALLMGMCVVIFLSVNKISASVLLTLAIIVLFVPIGKAKLPKWWRAACILAVFVFVIWNISTVDIPRNHYETGVKFFDQVLHIFNGFLRNIFGREINQSKFI